MADLRCYPKFTATFITKGALLLLNDYHKKSKLKILLLGATGGITRKITSSSSQNFHHVLLLPIEKANTVLAPGQTTPECYLVPVAEMVTNDSTGFTIAQFLRLVEHQLRKEFGDQRICDYIGTDFSWANFHVIFDLNGWSMKEYLRLSYECFESGKISPMFCKSTVPSSCFSHICKCIKNDINDHFKDKNDQRFIARLIGEIVDISDHVELDFYIKDVIVILGNEYQNSIFINSFTRLKKHYGFLIQGEEEEDEVVSDESQFIDKFLEYKSIYRDSRFFQRFENFSKSISQQTSKEKNKYFSPTFLSVLLSKYLAFLPTWTIFLGKMRNKDYTRGNNARIERYFQGIFLKKIFDCQFWN